MPVVIANKTHGTAANGIRLPVEYMNARTVFHNHDFMEVMMVFRESGLRQTRFNRYGRFT